MSQPTTDWRSYHGWNSRNARMAELWVRDLVAHLRARPGCGPGRAVLDFGCGYFDAGLALADVAGRVDGTDIDARALAVARGRAAGLPACHLYADADEVPRGTYDLIFASSVFQYLGTDDGVAQTLRLFRTLLRPGGAGEVLVADLIPGRYSPVRDAFRSLWVAARGGIFAAMTRYLWKAVRKGNALPLHRIDPDRFADLAAAAGFDCQRLPVNLTPSRQRYTCALTLRPATGRGC